MVENYVVVTYFKMNITDQEQLTEKSRRKTQGQPNCVIARSLSVAMLGQR